MLLLKDCKEKECCLPETWRASLPNLGEPPPPPHLWPSIRPHGQSPSHQQNPQCHPPSRLRVSKEPWQGKLRPLPKGSTHIPHGDNFLALGLSLGPTPLLGLFGQQTSMCWGPPRGGGAPTHTVALAPGSRPSGHLHLQGRHLCPTVRPSDSHDANHARLDSTARLASII